MLMYTTLMLILVSFFVVLLSRANFDETRFSTVVTSIKSSFGSMTGGRVAIGVDEGLPDQSLGLDQGGNLVLPDLETAQIRAVLAPALLDREARIIHTRNKRIISLSAGLMFNLDSTELTAEMAEILDAIAAIVADSQAGIAVEGHTNHLPPQTAGAGDNWDISSRRALAVLDHLVESGGLAPERLTAFGYAGTKPLYSTRTPEGRARNNRVDLVIDISQIRSRELDKMREKARAFNFQGFDFLLEEE